MDRPPGAGGVRRKRGSFSTDVRPQELIDGFDMEIDVSDPTAAVDPAATDSKVDVPVEELFRPISPIAQLADGQLLLLLRDYAGRLAGREGRALVAQLGEQDYEEKTTPPLASLFGSAKQVRIGFDSVSHILLPWPVPVDDVLELLTASGKPPPTQLAEKMRSKKTPGLGRYATGQELVALVDGIWLDALVLQAPDDLTSTVHKIQGGGSQHNLLLHPWNHAPQVMRCSLFNEIWTRQSTTLTAQHSFITDALSGQRLNVHHQCVPLDLEPAEKDSALPSVTDVGELYNWLNEAQAARRDIPSTLAKAARLVSNGQPDEAAQRVIKELADKQTTMVGPRRFGVEAIQRSQNEVGVTKDAYVSSYDRLLYQQKLDTDDQSSNDKRRDDEFRARQQQEELKQKKIHFSTPLLHMYDQETKLTGNRRFGEALHVILLTIFQYFVLSCRKFEMCVLKLYLKCVY